MPVFRIVYSRTPLPIYEHDLLSNHLHETEWVTPSGWTPERTAACFQQRTPGARVRTIADVCE